MKNWERFQDRSTAIEAHKAEKIVFGCGWGEIEWLYMDYIPGEPRMDYLIRLREHGILKGNGYAELRRVMKAVARDGAKKRGKAARPAPLSPEAELAATVARQKEVE